MNYYKAQEGIVRQYWRDNGYSGDRVLVGLTFDPESGYAIEVSDSGCYRANDQRYADEAEMLYYFDNHRSVHFRNVRQVADLIPTQHDAMEGRR